MKPIHPIALFRLSVLGSLTTAQLQRGELKQELERLAARHYDIPNSRRTQISSKTIEGWYYRYQRDGVDGLSPKVREDKGVSKLSGEVQEALVTAKQENPKRSIRQLVKLMEDRGVVPKKSLSRSAVHRLLLHHGISQQRSNDEAPVERRSFEARYAGDLWYGDVMHGPRVVVSGVLRKSYLVSLMDDASRLVPHSAFCLSETALEIEGVLKQALLKRGVPRRLVVDNGSAYRAESLQGICARLPIELIYCKPYNPEGKAKLERWHRTVRGQFLSELPLQKENKPLSLQQLNSYWWGWLEQHYHTTEHSTLGCAPIVRYQQDLDRIRGLEERISQIDTLFYHHIERKVRKDGSISYEGVRYEVDYLLSGQIVTVVVDPHRQLPIEVLDQQGESLSKVVLQDKQANIHRHRQQKGQIDLPIEQQPSGPTPVDLACQRHYGEEH